MGSRAAAGSPAAEEGILVAVDIPVVVGSLEVGSLAVEAAGILPAVGILVGAGMPAAVGSLVAVLDNPVAVVDIQERHKQAVAVGTAGAPRSQADLDMPALAEELVGLGMPAVAEELVGLGLQ
jgi:hypothetical protein